jgi:hypothetical protein
MHLWGNDAVEAAFTHGSRIAYVEGSLVRERIRMKSHGACQKAGFMEIWEYENDVGDPEFAV